MKTRSFTCVAIFLLSGGALAYEVILVRLLTMTRFYHLAFVVLSLALLGYGASGVLLGCFRTVLLRSFRAWFCLFAGIFALGAVLCFQLSQRITVHPGQWIWSPLETLHLATLYMILALPFFAAACAVGLAYCSTENATGGVYRADLCGAAVGSLGALATLWLPGAQALWLPWSAGFAAAAVMAPGNKKQPAMCFLALALLVPMINPIQAVRLRLSPDKPLAVALSARGARQTADIFTPLGRITVIENTVAPFRSAPGLSLAFGKPVAAQQGVFVDGDTFEPLLPESADTETLSYIDYLPEALTYRLRPHPRVLVLGPPFMEHLVRAGTQDAAGVDLVLSNPGWRTLFNRRTQTTPGIPPGSDSTRLTIAAPRGFLRTGGPSYDLIFIGPPDASALVADGLHTVQAYGEALKRLNNGGIISVSGPSDVPPRTGLRLLSTAAQALKMSGVAEPSTYLAVYRSLRTVHVLIKNTSLTAGEISTIRNFCRNRQFDPVWFPGITKSEVNQWNRLDTPLLHDGARQMLGPEAGMFQRQYKFDISPIFDNRPYFSRFLKLKTVKELFDLRGSGALGLLSYAEPVLAATLFQAMVMSVLVVWLPVRRFRPKKSSICWSVLFFLLGAGFMLVEFAVLEKLSLFLNEPVLAVAVTLAAFLAMAGLGGGISSRLELKTADEMMGYARKATLTVVGLIVIYLVALPGVLNALMARSLAQRVILALVLASPPAAVMGMCFPLTVSVLKCRHAASVPWAWGLNGCGALIGPVLGITLAIYAGVTMVLAAAACCYTAVFLVTRHGRLS